MSQVVRFGEATMTLVQKLEELFDRSGWDKDSSVSDQNEISFHVDTQVVPNLF